jgi:4-hydroxy-tetrahydrodipicolinate reductase
MKIALLGYGKMGKAIEAEALKRGHTILLKVDSEKDWIENEKLLQNADVAFEFSQPGTAVANIRRCFKADVPVVVGTTGWEQNADDVINEGMENDQTLFLASNFSPGMNIFFEINKLLAKLMNRFDQFDVTINELHHKHKLDAPSGTAKTLAGQIIENLDRKSNWVPGAKSSDSELEVFSKREAEAPGTHSVSYKSSMEQIDITHTATDRAVFAIGALMAAEWVLGKKGCFGMDDLLFDSK